MRLLNLLYMFISLGVYAQVNQSIVDTQKENFDVQSELLIQNDVDSLLMLRNAAWKWFQRNQSRLRVYDTPFEIPLSEVKSDGYLPIDGFIRSPGSSIGEDEMTAVWHRYTIKVMMIRDSLNQDQYRMILTTGDKSPELPQELVPSCYMYASYRNNGINQSWDWYLLPSEGVVDLPEQNTNCNDSLAIMENKALQIRNNWISYAGPTPIPNELPVCSVINVLPTGVNEPPTDYEDVIHCIFNFTPAPTYCDGRLYITRNTGSIVNYNLTQKPNDCNSTSQALYTAQFINESNTRISSLGISVSSVTCSLAGIHQINCVATEDATAPPPGSFCDGVLIVNLDGGGTSNFNLTQKPNNCDSSSQALYIAQFLTESNEVISSSGLDVSGLSCNTTNTHLDTCTATENMGSTGNNECKVYIYNIEGVLPADNSPNFEWNDRDCTGFWAGESGDTIGEHLSTVKHYANVYLNNNKRINSNEYSDYHYRDGLNLGSEFTNDIYYNSDEREKISEFVSIYNANNPTSQIEDCTEYLGALSALDDKHKVVCDPVETESPLTLVDVNAFSEWRYVPYEEGREDTAEIQTYFYSLLNTGAQGGTFVDVTETIGDVTGDEREEFREPWINLDAGITFADVISDGYGYVLTYSLTSTSNGGDPNVSISCSPGDSFDLVNGGELELITVGNWPSDNDAFVKCEWSGSINEYHNGDSTGKSSAVNIEMELKYNQS